MSDFPKNPLDFVVMTRPFTNDEIHKLLQQEAKNVIQTIEVLKIREVNAVKSLEKIKENIKSKIIELELKLDKSNDGSSYNSVLEAIKEELDKILLL